MRFSNIVNSLFAGFLPLRKKSRRQNLLDTPRYPPFMLGLPDVSVDELLATQEIMIARIREMSMLGTDTFNTCLMPCIYNYASFVHLLPASQDHHHRGAGGLLRHGLEVAYRSAGLAYSTSFVGADVVPQEKKPLESRWRVSCLLAGLCHDLGKPVSDLDIVDKNGERVWDPFDPATPYLVDFLRQYDIENYFLRWRKGRYRHHEDTSAIIFPRIVPQETLVWLGEYDPDIRFQLFQAVSRGTSAPNNNRFRDIVLEADRASLLEDMKHSFSATPTGTVGFATQRHIIDAMRHLFSTGVWKVNTIGGRVFVTNQGTFIAWPGNAGGADVVRYISENQIPAVTHDPDAIANDLIDIDVVEPFKVGDNTLRYWRVSLSLAAADGTVADFNVFCVKLKDPSYLIDTYVPPIAAIVHELEADEADEAEAAGMNLDVDADKVVKPRPRDNKEEDRAADVNASSGSVPIDGKQVVPTVTASVAPRTPPQGDNAEKEKERPGSPLEVIKKTVGGEKTGDDSIQSLLHSAFPASATAASSNDRERFASRGPIAASLLEIGSALREQSSAPAWFMVDRDAVCLAYPEAFEAVHVTTVPKVADLSATGMFVPDPMRPGSIVRRKKDSGRSWLQLNRESGRNFAAITLFGGIASSPSQSVRPTADSPFASSFPDDTDTKRSETAPKAGQRNAPTKQRRQSGQRDPASQGGQHCKEAQDEQMQRFGQRNTPHRTSSASIQYLEQLRAIYAAGEFSNAEAYQDGKRVFLHPNALRRFADSQGISEDRMRTILRLSDCLEAPFGDTPARGIRFPL